MSAPVGELAALGTAALFAVTSVCYTVAGRKIDSVTSIAMSLPLAWTLLAALHRAALGVFLPVSVPAASWLALAGSGFLAFVVSSYFMLNAYQSIGPRLALLIAALTPVMGALLAWLWLGQSLPARTAIGIVVVVAGIVWVVAERGGRSAPGAEIKLRRGVVEATLGTLAQAAAFVLAAQGLAGGVSPLSASLIRIAAGTTALWVFLLARGRARATAVPLRGDLPLGFLLAGAAVTGPVAATSLMLVALQYIPVGVATALSHTTAIMLLPVGRYVFGERVTWRAVVGTLVTIAGVALIFAA